jgi:toxin ParE1/3/4
MAKLIWSENAITDLENIYDFIAKDSPFYAKAQVDKIVNSVERLSLFPESGRQIPGFSYFPHREVIVGNYRVIYRFDSNSDEVKMITVLHGSRLLRESYLSDE